MKNRLRWLAPALFFLISSGLGGAQDLAFSMGSWSFFPNTSGWLPSGSPGEFAAFGLTYGLSPRFEAGASIIPRLSSEPFDDIFAEGHLGLSLFGDRIKKAGGPGIYINGLLDAGLLFGTHGILSGTAEYSKALFLRLTPITLGNPYYGRRDRILSVGLIYDVDANSASLFMNLIAADFFLASPAKVH